MNCDELIETGKRSWLEHLSEGPGWVRALLVPWVSKEIGENRWVDQSKLIPSPQPQTQPQSHMRTATTHPTLSLKDRIIRLSLGNHGIANSQYLFLATVKQLMRTAKLEKKTAIASVSWEQSLYWLKPSELEKWK